MQRLGSGINVGDSAYTKYHDFNLKLVEDLEEKMAKSRIGGGGKYEERHRSRNKLLPRERIDKIIDPGTAFGTGSHPSTRLCLEALDNDPPIGKTIAITINIQDFILTRRFRLPLFK